MSRRRATGHANAAGSYRWRARVLLALLVCAAGGLVWRAIDLQLFDHGFLSNQGAERFSRVVSIPAHRGTITDRYGEPLAVSTPVDAVWVDPGQLIHAAKQIPRLAGALHLDPQQLAHEVASNLDRQFLYVARQLQPDAALKVKALGIPGVHLKREYRRYYPAGEVTGQVIGFTNIDDAGQDGLELAFDQWLAGHDGAKRVIQDRYGHIVQNVESISPARPGRDLVLSLDLRIQYVAYRELKRAVLKQHARGGSIVVLDVTTGEVLAMVNQPSFNPNDRDQLHAALYRNRAVTDMFEPGSSIKPFFVAAALTSGKYNPQSLIDTSPGFIKVDTKVFRDEHDLGRIDLATVLAKSSNVGMAHLALSLQPGRIWSTLSRFGFGRVTTSGFPGESAGVLSGFAHWRPIDVATMSHGYGLAVTTLQLAHAYATLGAYGVRRPVTFLRVEHAPAGRRVLNPRDARELVHMLKAVVYMPGATGTRAAIPGYSVAGKTGTAQEDINGSYSDDRYMAVFAGIAPASDPRLAVVVNIDSPSAGSYYGGQVSAPVFARVMGRALRLLAVAPDRPVSNPLDAAPPLQASR